MSEIMDLRKEKNFFETRVIEYQTAGALTGTERSQANKKGRTRAPFFVGGHKR
jgi:hypothetical protein